MLGRTPGGGSERASFLWGNPFFSRGIRSRCDEHLSDSGLQNHVYRNRRTQTRAPKVDYTTGILAASRSWTRPARTQVSRRSSPPGPDRAAAAQGAPTNEARQKRPQNALQGHGHVRATGRQAAGSLGEEIMLGDEVKGGSHRTGTSSQELALYHHHHHHHQWLIMGPRAAPPLKSAYIPTNRDASFRNHQ